MCGLSYIMSWDMHPSKATRSSGGFGVAAGFIGLCRLDAGRPPGRTSRPFWLQGSSGRVRSGSCCNPLDTIAFLLRCLSNFHQPILEPFQVIVGVSSDTFHNGVGPALIDYFSKVLPLELEVNSLAVGIKVNNDAFLLEMLPLAAR